MLINERDNVTVDLETGHKRARVAIAKGEAVIKYGYPIGIATEDIREGEPVHTHNMKTALGEKLEYEYKPSLTAIKKTEGDITFLGYERENGEVGIRNEIWIIPTVGCVNKVAEQIADATGAIALTHPYGCSQLGDDHARTQEILAGLVRHPNAGGVLVLGLGCENNNIDMFKTVLGEYDRGRVKFLVCQECSDELAEGVRLVRELEEFASHYCRKPIPISRLCVGLKCGGSDGYSGISANPLVGRVTDLLTSRGASCLLTEVPEMFGAEQILMERCESREVFDRTVALINDFKDYYTRHGQVVYENPSPGNKAGGITTLEEKSLGCIQKGGSATVVDVLDYGERVRKSGLSLLNGPGNDGVAITNLTAAGAHLILFTTGRGTPLGAPVPTIKISTNTPLASRKNNWIDFDAGPILLGKELTNELFSYIIEVAEGSATKNETAGFKEITIFKDGVTL